MKRDRDHLFAEAVVAYRASEQWWPTADFEEKHASVEQAERYEGDAWEEPIQKFLDRALKRKDPRVTVLQVARGCLDFKKIDRLGSVETRRITNVMTQLSWRRANRGHGGVRYWEKG